MNQILVTDDNAPLVVTEQSVEISVENLSTVASTITITASGAQGPAGPDPWLEPIQYLTADGGTLLIDYSLGKHVVLTVQADTVLDVTGWPLAGRIARLTLETINDGAFQITGWPAGTKSQQGQIPILTTGPNGEDTIVLTSIDGGASIKLYLAGITFI